MKKAAFIVVSLLVLTISSQAGASNPRFLPHGTHLSVKQKVAYFERSIRKDQTAIAWFKSHRHVEGRSSAMRWYKNALRWHQNLLSRYNAKLAPTMGYWVARQINVATAIARASSSDPWPNCPDPFYNGATWQDTVNCENNGNWYDSPGYYRCGLQFDPGWESKYGRLCP